MDQEPKRRMDGMGPRVGMDGMARRPAAQPAPRPVPPVPATKPAPVPVPPPAPAPKRPARPAAPAPAPKPAPAKPAPQPVQAASGGESTQPPRRWLRRSLQAVAWLAIILAVASALVELYVRYYQ